MRGRKSQGFDFSTFRLAAYLEPESNVGSSLFAKECERPKRGFGEHALLVPPDLC